MTMGGDHQYLSSTHITPEYSKTADPRFFTPPHSHSIVPQPLNGLFLFGKSVTPLHFSRQPYRQNFWLLISLGKFDRLKISPIAYYRRSKLNRGDGQFLGISTGQS
jgi:hypothetical protein